MMEKNPFGLSFVFFYYFFPEKECLQIIKENENLSQQQFGKKINDISII